MAVDKFDDSNWLSLNVHNLIIFSHHISLKADDRAPVEYTGEERQSERITSISDRDAFPLQARYISTAHSTFHVHVVGWWNPTKHNGNNGVNVLEHEYDEQKLHEG